MSGGLVLIAVVFALVAGCVFLLFSGARARKPPPHAAEPLSMAPYILTCFVSYGACLVLLVAVNMHSTLPHPRYLALMAPIISISLAIWRFTKLNRRALLFTEKCWLTVGCFVVAWLYDVLWSVVSPGNGADIVAKIATTIFASIIDLAVVGIIVAVGASLAPRLLAMPSEPPNNRWSGRDA
jgi:hypothetical protein